MDWCRTCRSGDIFAYELLMGNGRGGGSIASGAGSLVKWLSVIIAKKVAASWCWWVRWMLGHMGTMIHGMEPLGMELFAYELLIECEWYMGMEDSEER